MTIKFEQAEFLFLKDVAEEILSSDTYHPSLRRTLPGTDGTKIWHTFHRNGTKAAILCAMLVAIEKGLDPISEVSDNTGARGTRQDTAPSKPEPDTFTDAALQQQGDAPKPDFATLKARYGKSPSEIIKHNNDTIEKTRVEALNADIGAQEEELIPHGKMEYKAPQPESTPTPTEAPKNKGGRPKKTFPAKTAEETLDDSLKENK